MKSHFRNLWNNLHDTTMFLTIVLWLCVLPLVLWLTIPFFGWQGAGVSAAITLVAALVACYGICTFSKIPSEEELNAHRPRLR